MSRNTVMDGSREFDGGAGPSDRVRREGGGRPALIDLDPDLLTDLDDLVEPDARGDPMSPLRWTLKSTRKLAEALVAMGHQVSHSTVHALLGDMGYSLQATAKTVEGAQHPDRNAQFTHINATAKAFLAAGQPVVSVDCKKKELVGAGPGYRNAGREWQPEGKPNKAGVHDFPDPDMPKAVPYGVYDLGANEGWMSVGDDHDTAAFAVNAIRRWWQTMGAERYPKAKRLLVTPPMPVGPTATATASGRSSWPNSQPRSVLTSPCATTRRGPRSGTKSSTASSVSSLPTGEAAPSPPTAPSSSSSERRPPRPGSRSEPSGIRAITRQARRSPTLSWPDFRSSPTSGTASGTTRSSHPVKNASSSWTGP